MKRIFFTLTMIATVATGFAQSNKVISANNYLKNGDLAKAKENIDAATVHEKTMNERKTWFYRGKVYLALAATEDEKFQKLDSNAIYKAAEAFEKALELDGRRIGDKEIQQQYQITGRQMFAVAIQNYKSQNYPNASKAFENSAAISSKFGITDTSAIFNAGLTAELAGDTAKAIEQYRESAKLGYKDGALFVNVAKLEKGQGNIDAALNTLKEGRKLYPENGAILTELINIYLTTGKTDDALAMLNEAIKKDSSNAQLYFARGTLYDKKGMSDKATADYESAIAVDPDNYESYYNLGAVYVNRSAEIQEKMNNLDISKKEEYKKLKAERDTLYEKAIKPLEKAHELNPEDRVTMQTLLGLYGKTNQMEKYKEMKAKFQKENSAE